ncbi:uncharacterized protein LOC133828261 [Humulus lupulus]|uniref:uncharacterized protein LOC133828261 n=1 Tax=Humulus lupulus TaxID=3486 RepID=UPI002B418442|nr:uncharacterized protein LOC133828261 [Humulus lupulus]
MDKTSKRRVLFIFWFITISILITLTKGESLDFVHKQEDIKQSFTKILRSTISLLKTFHQNTWEKIKTLMQEIQFQYFPPNLDFKGVNEANARGGAGGKMTKAVGRSFGTSKETVEETAKSAAEVVDKTMVKTAKKVKESVSDEESAAEL